MPLMTTEIYTLSLHDALPIYDEEAQAIALEINARNEESKEVVQKIFDEAMTIDRKSTRLNSSH